MGSNRRYAGRIIPAWAETLGACVEHQVRLQADCDRDCGRDPQEAAADIVAGYDERTSPWNSRFPCTCGGSLLLCYSPGPSTPFRPMQGGI